MNASIPSVDSENYWRDGFLVVRNVFSSELMMTYQEAWADLKAKMESGKVSLQRNARFVVGLLPDPLGSIYRHRHLVEIAKQLLGDDTALYYNRLLVKDEVWSGAVEVHQDMPFFHGNTNKLSVFVPLTPFNESTGGLKILAGSHRWGNLGIRGALRIDEFPSMPVVCPALEPGDVLLMTFLTWHYSEAPKVPCERPLLQIVYQPADDGSYFKDGLPGPTLVSGEWLTTHFIRFEQGVEPFAAPPAASTDEEATQLRAQVAEQQTEVATLRRLLEVHQQQAESLARDREGLASFKQAVEASAGWRALNRWRRFRESLAPEGTARGRLYHTCMRRFRGLRHGVVPSPIASPPPPSTEGQPRE